MKSKRLPFLSLLPLLLTSCNSYYEVECLYAVEDISIIPQIGFTDDVTLSLTPTRTTAPSYEGYWIKWKEDVVASDFRLTGNLEGKTVSKVEVDSENLYTVKVTLSGDCTAAYRDRYYGAIKVDQSAFTLNNPEMKGVTAFMCMVVTGPTTEIVKRDWDYNP